MLRPTEGIIFFVPRVREELVYVSCVLAICPSVVLSWMYMCGSYIHTNTIRLSVFFLSFSFTILLYISSHRCNSLYSWNDPTSASLLYIRRTHSLCWRCCIFVFILQSSQLWVSLLEAVIFICTYRAFLLLFTKKTVTKFSLFSFLSVLFASRFFFHSIA